MLGEAKSFFDRPLQDKLSISYEDSPSFRGYMRLGLEKTAGVVNFREQLEYAVEYDREGLPSWPVYEWLKGKNSWPDNFQPTLRSTTVEYSKKVCQVADVIRDSLCLALQLDPRAALHEKFVDPEEVPHWIL